MAKQKIYFDKDIVRIQERKVSFSFSGINVYKCKPIVQHPAGEIYFERGFDLYLHCDSWEGKKLENGKRETKKLEIVVCFAWLGPKHVSKVKQYTISGFSHFECHCIAGFAINRFLIKKLGYRVENWH